MMKSLPLSFLIAAALLAGCAPLQHSVRPAPEAPAKAQAEAQAAAQAKADEAAAAEEAALRARLPKQALTPRMLQEFLLAEIAARRGRLDEAGELYLDLARTTRDPRIARRATEIALHGRRIETALAASRLWLESDPESAAARQAMIGLLAAAGRFEELKVALPAWLAADARQLPGNLMRLNRLFARGGDRKAVREIVDQVTTPYLELPEAHFARAQAAFEARELTAARAALQRALELKPDWELAALFRAQITANHDVAMQELGQFVAANPQAREARLAYARALANDRSYEEARREFRILLEQGAADPAKNGDIVFAVAVLSLQLNDTQEAEKHLRRLVDIDHPEADRARFFLGQIAEEGKRWNDALKWFDAVGRGEHYLPARLHAAGVLAKQGKLDAARETLHSAEAGTPRERNQLVIGEAQLLREAGRIADAHAVLVAALERQPDEPELLYEAALLAERLGRVDEMESRLRRLIELRPDHAHAYNALGFSLADRNIRLAEARALIDRALELAPDDPFILDSKGWVLFRQGEMQAALEALQHAYGLRADPEIAAHLGEVLWTLGRKEEARQTWEKARRANPANEALAETIKRFLP
ncbi:tetratricopeptide repeat protein [Sulfuricystis thermophila]|uniref:tetratricopeptide repeat protein n=1 Tax=Sulfuricystis thermophila TaxID=2496847 RepID=UPI0024DF3B5C|nr:tetratricopeptide repeat protein [Sulfuricystis thermophila]